MNLFTAIIFGIFGIASGVILPDLTNLMIRYKNKRRTIEIINRGFNKKFWIGIILLNGLFWTYAGIRVENIYIAATISLIFSISILISIIDIQVRLIPNELVAILFGLSIPFQLLLFGWESLLYAFLCMLLVGFAFILVGRMIGIEQVGAGDVKLAAGMGLIIGYPNILIALLAMSVGLIFFCSIGLITKKMTFQTLFPFAPFLMFGQIFTLIYLVEHI